MLPFGILMAAEKDFRETEEITNIARRLYSLSPSMAEDTIYYVFGQLDTATLRGRINYSEYSILLRESIKGLLSLIYLKRFSRDLADKESFRHAAKILTTLLFTRVLNGLDVEVLKEQIQASRPVAITQR